MCKSLDSLENRVDSKLSEIVDKLNTLESNQMGFGQQVETIKAKVGQLDSKTTKLDIAFWMVEDDFWQLE